MNRVAEELRNDLGPSWCPSRICFGCLWKFNPAVSLKSAIMREGGVLMVEMLGGFDSGGDDNSRVGWEEEIGGCLVSALISDPALPVSKNAKHSLQNFKTHWALFH